MVSGSGSVWDSRIYLHLISLHRLLYQWRWVAEAVVPRQLPSEQSLVEIENWSRSLLRRWYASLDRSLVEMSLWLSR
jgi:hypothetical protein